MNLEIKGTIVKIFPVLYLYQNEIQFFNKQKIVLLSDGESYIVDFVGKKIDLLKNCRINQEVIVSVYLKGKTWTYNGKDSSTNELKCHSLKILKNNNFDIEPIKYNEELYTLKKYEIDGCLHLNLFNIVKNNEIEISIKHEFPDKTINANHILYDLSLGEELLLQLVEKGILEKGISISGNEILGCICKVLVKDLFEDDDNLYNYSKADIIKYLAKNFMNSLNNE